MHCNIRPCLSNLGILAFNYTFRFEKLPFHPHLSENAVRWVRGGGELWGWQRWSSCGYGVWREGALAEGWVEGTEDVKKMKD